MATVYATWFLLFYLFFICLFACNFCGRMDHRCGRKLQTDFSTSESCSLKKVKGDPWSSLPGAWGQRTLHERSKKSWDVGCFLNLLHVQLSTFGFYLLCFRPGNICDGNLPSFFLIYVVVHFFSKSSATYHRKRKSLKHLSNV